MDFWLINKIDWDLKYLRFLWYNVIDEKITIIKEVF